MLKKLSLLVSVAVGLFALSFSSTNKISKPQYIEIDGHKYQYVIATASRTGTYYKAGSKLAAQLPQAIAAETDGSIQNMDLLNKGIVNVAFVQGDAYNLWCNSHRAECSTKFSVIETNHPEVISTSHYIMSPKVLFLEFGDSSLNFEMRFFLRDISKRRTVTSDVNFAIDKAFREANIEIPFPQRDVHFRRSSD